MLKPTDPSVIVKPLIEALFAQVGQGHAGATTDPAQWEITFLREQDTKG
jgi:hypothetical protein